MKPDMFAMDLVNLNLAKCGLVNLNLAKCGFTEMRVLSMDDPMPVSVVGAFRWWSLDDKVNTGNSVKFAFFHYNKVSNDLLQRNMFKFRQQFYRASKYYNALQLYNAHLKTVDIDVREMDEAAGAHHENEEDVREMNETAVAHHENEEDARGAVNEMAPPQLLRR